jgi:hypothetical protein
VEIDTPIKPAPRHEAAAAYDGLRNRMVMFGGSSGEGEEQRYSDETWWYPNGAPVISHEPILGAYPGMPLEVAAGIQDYDEDGITARLFYRIVGEESYKSVAMSLSSSDEFTGTIPGADINEMGLEYYLRAGDPEGSGDYGFSGSRSEPYLVSIGNTGSLKVFIGPKSARKKGEAAWRLLGTKEWLKSGDVAKELKPGPVTIEFKTIPKWNKPAPLTMTIIHGKRNYVKATYVREVL